MLVYTSEVLSEPVEVTVPLQAVLYAASSARDADWVVKLCDVDRAGTSLILAEGILRARNRDGFTGPRPIEPDRVYEYRINLVATSNMFLPGHRIRVLVMSSSFPRFDRNTGTGAPLGIETASDLMTATQSIFHDAELASHVVLPVVR